MTADRPSRRRSRAIDTFGAEGNCLLATQPPWHEVRSLLDEVRYVEAMSAPGSQRVTVELDVPARMRDGVTLRANVYRPEGPGPWPTLLNRTPYGKDAVEAVSWPGVDPVQAARRGFLVVIQDVRGRFASDGEWEPFRHEAQDGFDTIEWAARLPGSSGRVGMYGGSYHGNVQWLAALERPPSLGAIAPSATWSEPLDGAFARGGAVELGLALIWALETGEDHLARAGRSVEPAIDELDRLADAGYWELPVAAAAPLRRHGVPDMGALAAVGDPAVAARCRVRGRHDRVAVPSFHTAGWYDIFVQGTLENYEAASAAGREARLVVGPWAHEDFVDPVGELAFGTRAGRDGMPPSGWSDLHLAWLRRQLDPAAGTEPAEPPVRIFVMGRDEWRDEPAWPLSRARAERWFLHADGSLGTDRPGAGAAASEFVYDPARPVPTVGGHGAMAGGYRAGPCDQARVEAREDVLVFTSEPLDEELEVTGRVRAVLHARSSAPSTDWVVRLCDVHPDGRSFNLCDGIVRVADGADRLRRIEIDLWSTSNAFLPGHRLRVHVTSSSFPRWDRNLNTGDQRTPHFASARQRVHHDADRPSYVELPVVRAAR